MKRGKPQPHILSTLSLVILGCLILLNLVPTTTMGRGGVGLLPPRTTLNLLPGETGSYELKIHNGSGSQVTVALSVSVSQAPPGASVSHLSIDYPSLLVAKPGNSFASVVLIVSPSAVPGTYILTNALSF